MPTHVLKRCHNMETKELLLKRANELVVNEQVCDLLLKRANVLVVNEQVCDLLFIPTI